MRRLPMPRAPRQKTSTELAKSPVIVLRGSMTGPYTSCSNEKRYYQIERLAEEHSLEPQTPAAQNSMILT